jgi:hypothetical protein
MDLSRRRFILVLLVGITALQVYAQSLAPSNHWSVLRLIEYHQQLRPKLRVQDIYKLLYQVNFGVEHLLTDTAGVRKYLFDELAIMDTTNHGERLIERISPSDDIVRINLRPFKQLQLDPEKLVQAMFLSALETKPDTEGLNHDWNEFLSLVRYGFLDFPMKDVEEWDARVSAGSLQPAHHSQKYGEPYKPAYRVVKRAVFESTFRDWDLRESIEGRRE